MKYSIITINYNNKEGLRRTIESVVYQTYQDFEYIIIDGGSTDGSVEVIKEYAAQIDYWVSEPDKGIYNAMNKGIRQAHGDYLNFMNSGDKFISNDVLENLHTYDDDIYSTNICYSHSSNKSNFKIGKYSLYDFCAYAFNHQATFFRRELFEYELYDENLQIMSDWKFVVRMSVLYNASFRMLDLVTVEFDTTGISMKELKLGKSEKFSILAEILPPSILNDYIFLYHIRTPLLYELPYLSTTYRLHKIIWWITRNIIKFNRFLK